MSASTSERDFHNLELIRFSETHGNQNFNGKGKMYGSTWAIKLLRIACLIQMVVSRSLKLDLGLTDRECNGNGYTMMWQKRRNYDRNVRQYFHYSL